MGKKLNFILIVLLISFAVFSAEPMRLCASALKNTNEKDVIFIACHPGAGAHFAEFAKNLRTTDLSFGILAAENAYKKCKAQGIEATEFYQGSVPLIDLEQRDLEQLATKVCQKCLSSRVVLVDVGHPFMEILLQRLKQLAPNVKRIAYVDNPEPIVPGNYSEVALRVMRLADAVVYANARLAWLPHEKGLGYYPVEEALALKEKRQQRVASFTKTAVYVGGASAEYIERALPAFLNILDSAVKIKDLSEWTIIFQQHPRAATEYNNADKKLVEEWIRKAPKQAPTIEFSEKSLSENLLQADLVLYYQTSDSPKFVIAGIPAVQVGLRYEDIPVRYGFVPSVLTAEGLIQALEKHNPAQDVQEFALEAVGYRSDWFARLQNILID